MEQVKKDGNDASCTVRPRWHHCGVDYFEAHLGVDYLGSALGRRTWAAESTTWAAHLGGGIDSTRKSEAGNAATNENRIEC